MPFMRGKEFVRKLAAVKAEAESVEDEYYGLTYIFFIL